MSEPRSDYALPVNVPCTCEHSHRSAICPKHGEELLAEVRAKQEAEDAASTGSRDGSDD